MLKRQIITTTVVFVLSVGTGFLSSGCGKASSPTSPSGPAKGDVDVSVTIQGNLGNKSYTPSPITMKVGQTINWLNLDDQEHTATLDGMFDTGRIAIHSAHDSPIRMNTAGTFTYHCSIHPSMVGQVVVQ